MIRAEIVTRAGIIVYADMEEAHLATLRMRWSAVVDPDKVPNDEIARDGVVALVATDTGVTVSSEVLLSEIAAIRRPLKEKGRDV